MCSPRTLRSMDRTGKPGPSELYERIKSGAIEECPSSSRDDVGADEVSQAIFNGNIDSLLSHMATNTVPRASLGMVKKDAGW